MEQKIEKDKLKPFKQHGVVFKGANDTQSYGDCPFTGGQNKFYVNRESLLWDSKTAGMSGNVRGFLEEINKQNIGDMNPTHMKRLADNRGLPAEAFKGYELGYAGSAYTFPVRNEDGKLMDLRIYSLGKRILSTSGCAVWLFNVKDLVSAPAGYPVYLCEGEWDTIAMAWLLKKLDIQAVAVGTPGATTFKREWCEYFRNRTVHVCYDNDEAGEQGEVVVEGRLRGIAKSVDFIHWPMKLPSGYDLRDYITTEAVKMKMPKKTFRTITEMLKKVSRKAVNAGESESGEFSVKAKDAVVVKRTTFADVEVCFKKWLYLKNTDAIKLAATTILSTSMPGDPLWMFLVAPPGGSKTEILSAFNNCSNVYLTSSLTPHALVSGANERDGQDPSMLPKLNEKTLIIKDYTVIIGKKEQDKEEIFSIFRDAYDGYTSKDFGNGIKRSYHCHFSILAGVTPVIYNQGMQQAGLGERFLKYYIGESINHPSEIEMMRRAMRNVSQESVMRAELSAVAKQFIEYKLTELSKPGFKYPTIPEDVETKLLYAVQYAAQMRGTVTRDLRNNDIVTSKPFREVGTRLSKNLAKLLINLAFVLGKTQVDMDDFAIVKKVVLDTIDQRAEEVVRKIYLTCPTLDDTIATREVARRTRYNTSTIGRIMNDYNLLRIIERTGKNNKFEWTVSSEVREYIEKGGFYTLESEKKRVRLDEEIFEARKTNKKVVVKLKRRIEDGTKRSSVPANA